ncbi:MAG: transposase, partial [Microbacterium sp.]|nr:transposase [Microbacterium sp.]
GGEGAKLWLQVLTEIKNRSVDDVCIAVCDGLKGLPEAITTAWPQTVVQTCVLHLIGNTFRYASRRYWEQLAKDLRPVYTAPTEAAAQARFAEFAEPPSKASRRPSRTANSTRSSSRPCPGVSRAGSVRASRTGSSGSSGCRSPRP